MHHHALALAPGFAYVHNDIGNALSDPTLALALTLALTLALALMLALAPALALAAARSLPLVRQRSLRPVGTPERGAAPLLG